jgi:AcrR family transcriptional regulator
LGIQAGQWEIVVDTQVGLTLDALEAQPRSARHAAIFNAVFDLLGEVGYDRMTMDAVAARARASKATIYRAWPNKPDLVMDALSYRFGDAPEMLDTGSLRGDLIALMTGACQIANGPDGAVVAGIMSAATRNAELSKTLYRCTYEMKHVVHEEITKRAIARGELPVDAKSAVLHEIMHSLVLTRKLWAVGPLDEVFVVHVVDDVLMPVLRVGCDQKSPQELTNPD